jgi:DNA-binding transcriptional ArsR family regulator
MRASPPLPATARLDQAAEVIRCLGHPLRLRLLDALAHGASTVTELQRRTGTSQATVSQHLGVLRGHRVVQARREGSFVHYVITEPKVHRILDCIRGCGA